MRAIVQDKYGGAEVLRLEETGAPTPGRGQMRVRVRAAALDAGVWVMTTGRPRVARVAFGLFRPRVRVAGQEFAGTVDAVGPGVEGFAVGDDVFGTGIGSFAELALAKAGKISRRPPGLTFEAAAALPVSGTTALQAVRDAGKVRPGQRVMVIGAGGNVGSFAVQLAAELGARVTGVASGGKADLVTALGAEKFIDYTRESLTSAGPHDVVIDTAGNRPLRDLRALLTERGTAVVVGPGLATQSPLGGMERQFRTMFVSPFVRQRLTGILGITRPRDLDTLADLTVHGRITPAVDSVRPLAEASDAVRVLGEGHGRGKTVLVL